MMRKTCFTKYTVALLLALSATSCTKEQNFKELAAEQFSANFKALVMGNKTIDAHQDWSTVATIPVEVSVSFDNADQYSVYIYQTPPTLNKDAAYIGMARLRSGESKTIPVVKPAKVGLLYASCVDADGHAVCKPFVAMADGCSVSFEGKMSPSSTIGMGNAWSVPTTSRPDIARYTSGLVEMTDAENETGREDSAEKHLLIGNKYDGLINRLNTFSNQSVYVVGTWNLTFDQRVTNGNIIIVGNGGRIVVPRGFKLTTKSTNADVADGRIYVMEGGYITGEGELEISSGTESNNYSNGNIFVKTLTLNGGALYNYGSLGDGSSTVTELVGREDAKGTPGLLINHGTTTVTGSSGDALAIYNAATITSTGELALSKSSRMDDGSYMECNTLSLNGQDGDVLFMGNGAYVNCTSTLNVDNYGVWGPSGNGFKANAIFKVNRCGSYNNSSSAASAFLLDHVELLLPDDYPSIVDDGAIREWDSDIKSYGIGTLSPTYPGYNSIRLIYDWMNGYQGKTIDVTNYQWAVDGKGKYNYNWSNATSPRASGVDESRQTCVMAKGPSYSSDRSGTGYTAAFQKGYDTPPVTNYVYYAFEIADDNHDFNYNDVIFRIPTPTDNNDGTFTSIAEIVAVGTGLSTTILLNNEAFGREIHIALGTSSTGNISRINRNFRNLDTLTFNTPDIVLDKLDYKLHIVNSNNADNQFSEVNQILDGSPSYLVINGDAEGKWYWPLDKMNIGLAYPLFNVWGSNISAAPDWYNSKNAATGKVLTW